MEPESAFMDVEEAEILLKMHEEQNANADSSEVAAKW